MNLFAAAGMICALMGALLLYLASPNQLAWKGPRPGRLLGWAGGALLIFALVLLLQWAGPATAVFIVLTLVMLAWSFVPPLAAWIGGDQKSRRKVAR